MDLVLAQVDYLYTVINMENEYSVSTSAHLNVVKTRGEWRLSVYGHQSASVVNPFRPIVVFVPVKFVDPYGFGDKPPLAFLDHMQHQVSKVADPQLYRPMWKIDIGA
jgi:hypothetical protein